MEKAEAQLAIGCNPDRKEGPGLQTAGPQLGPEGGHRGQAPASRAGGVRGTCSTCEPRPGSNGSDRGPKEEDSKWSRG